MRAFLILGLACADPKADSAEAEPSDTAEDTADTDTAEPEPGVVSVTNGASVALSGAIYAVDWWVMSGVPLQPGDTEAWDADPVSRLNVVYYDLDGTGGCWGVEGLVVAANDELTVELGEPVGEPDYDAFGLETCLMP